MASKKSYSRYFIILQEDERGFGLSSGKAPTGYAKIETKNSKCKISYYVQNLKPDDKYSMLLICGKKGCRSLINIGNMRLDEQGRADVSYEYDEENIGGSNTSVDKIIGAAIARIMDNNVISLMSGFITTDIPKDWKTYNIININDNRDLGNIFESYEEEIERSKETIKDNDKVKVKHTKVSEDRELKEKEDKERTKEVEKKDKKVDIKETKKEDERIEDKVEVNENIQGDQLETNNENIDINKDRNKDIEDEINDIGENKDDVKNIEEINQNGKKNSQEITQKNKEVRDSKCDCIEKNQCEYRKNQHPMKSMENFFEDLGNGFEKYCDIFPKIHKSVWYKIPVEDMEHMCDMSDYQKYVVMHYPMINYYSYIKDYKHYLVGYKYDENCRIKYIMYAIPGSKSPNCQPFKGKTGFVTWMKSYNLNENQGYWIMFYDFKNYNILIPIKKNK